MDVRLQDVLWMRKAHPCGGDRFEVLRVGMDFRLRCLKCGHEWMMSRAKCERHIKKIIRDEVPLEDKHV